MKVSLSIVRSLINFELPSVDKLVSRVNQQLGGVEEVIDLGAKYSGARIVRVVECGKHPDADRLSVTKIDDGGAVPDVPRDDNGYVQVVCGAPNVHADMWAIWLPPGSTVPASFDDAEPFVLGARPLRGVLSQGMLAAADERLVRITKELLKLLKMICRAVRSCKLALALLKSLAWTISCWISRTRCLRTGQIVSDNWVWPARLLGFLGSNLPVRSGTKCSSNLARPKVWI